MVRLTGDCGGLRPSPSLAGSSALPHTHVRLCRATDHELASKDLLDGAGTNHEGRGVDVTAGNAWHNRSIGNSQTFDAVHP